MSRRVWVRINRNQRVSVGKHLALNVVARCEDLFWFGVGGRWRWVRSAKARIWCDGCRRAEGAFGSHWKQPLLDNFKSFGEELSSFVSSGRYRWTVDPRPKIHTDSISDHAESMRHDTITFSHRSGQFSRRANSFATF